MSVLECCDLNRCVLHTTQFFLLSLAVEYTSIGTEARCVKFLTANELETIVWRAAKHLMTTLVHPVVLQILQIIFQPSANTSGWDCQFRYW